ncbi:MAG: NAD-dependent epimerase/dehydratase family protein [Deltaproteobacteria bacterium]|nr:NAD-dependent epimerase/dehydratase family protein [Deltaproteobacteria bacterium]
MSLAAQFQKLAGAKCLVSGGAGFIGSHLVDALLEIGAEVKVLDNLETGSLENLQGVQDQVTFLEGDLRNLDDCQKAAQGTQFVFHQAALGSVPRSVAQPATSLDVNVAGTANLLQAARDQGVKRFVYASSSSVYGDSEKLPKYEGQEGKLLSPYALSKHMNEELAELFSRTTSLNCVGLRYFNIYGPRQSPNGPYAAVIPLFFASCAAGKAPIILGDGSQSRDFTYVADAVRSNLLAAVCTLDDDESLVCNVGAGGRTLIRNLASVISTVVTKGLPPSYQPARPGDVMHSLADATRAQQHLGFQAEIDLEEGISRTWKWMLSNSNS